MMPSLATLLDDDQAAALARLQLKLTISPPPAATPTTAICPACGQMRPAPAATFRPPPSNPPCRRKNEAHA
jgi:hypothetical protein